jgi:predicted permease
VLASAAGLAGLLLASLLVRALVALAPADLPRIDDVGIDASVVLFALGLTSITALLFGLVPAIHASRLDMAHTMTQGGSRGVTTNRGARTRAALVVTEVALSVVLLAAAGLLLRSFQRLQHVDLGFTTERIVVATTEYAVSDAMDLQARGQFFAGVLGRLRAVPGVSAAAGVAYLGMGREPRSARDYFVEGRPEGRPGERPQAEIHDITEDYFRTLETPILAGRDFAALDRPESPLVAMVNETLARQAFSGESPLGERVRFGTSITAPWLEIVGVVGDARWQDPSRPPPPVIFRSTMQGFGNSPSILARTSLDEAALASTLRTLLHEADPTVPVRFETMEELFADAIVHERFRAQMIVAFASVAALLAAVGLFSVLAFLVGQRTREIGVRRAVGASTGDIVRLVVGQGLRWVATGLVVGACCAAAFARLLETLLFEVGPWDVVTHLGGVFVIGAVALLATLVPVLRAASIAPLVALRPE